MSDEVIELPFWAYKVYNESNIFSSRSTIINTVFSLSVD